jgi:hypothetical protein
MHTYLAVQTCLTGAVWSKHRLSRLGYAADTIIRFTGVVESVHTASIEACVMALKALLRIVKASAVPMMQVS